MAHRMSHYSGVSNNQSRTNTMQHNISQQMSTSSCLNACHSAYTASHAHPLESSTSLVVNTWVTGSSTGPDGRYGGTVDGELARRAWEHARRRAEDGAVVLGSMHHSTPSLLAPFVSALPLSVPGAFYTALNALRPFLHTVTPFNPSLPRYSSLSAVLTFSLAGDITAASLGLSTSGIDTKNGLLNVPAEPGYRAFDVFYYLLTSPSQQEREYLGLKHPSKYALLRKSETYTPPSFLPTADDAAAAEDFRESLKQIGVKGKNLKYLLSVVAAILRLGDAIGFLVDQEELESTCEDVGGLLDVDPEVLLKKCVTEEREVLIAGLYEALVDWVIARANEAIRFELQNGRAIGSTRSGESDSGVATPPSSDDDGDSVSITVIEIPSQTLGKAVALKTVFDDSTGINAEMREDGVPFVPAGSSVIREMKDAISHTEPDLDIMTGSLGRERENEVERRQAVLEKIGLEAEADSFVRTILFPASATAGITLGKTNRFSLPQVLESSRVWFHLCLHPSDDSPATFASQRQNAFPWHAASVSSQIRSWRLPEWANHRNKQLDFTADFDIEEFVDRYSRLGCQGGREGVEAWILERGWSNGEVIVGSERVWIREGAWGEAEGMLDLLPQLQQQHSAGIEMDPFADTPGLETGYGVQTPAGIGEGFFAPNYGESRENLLGRAQTPLAPSRMGGRSLAPTIAGAQTMRSVHTTGGDYGLGRKGDVNHDIVDYGDGVDDGNLADGKHVEVQRTTWGRRAWVAATWAATWWIPSFVLKYVGGMKRPDVRLAWREKVLLVLLIFLINATVVFWIVEFGNLICPNWDKVWDRQEVSYHQGDNDFWVSYRGGVYDLSHFWKLQHSDSSIEVTTDLMQPFAGTDVSEYIVPPLTIACPGLVNDTSVVLQSNNTLTYPQATHVSGPLQGDTTTKLHDINWYTEYFLPRMKTMYKGPLVYQRSKIHADGQDNSHMWFIINKKVYDLTDYFYTLKMLNGYPTYAFFGEDVATLVQSNPGADLSELWFSTLNYTMAYNGLNCLNNAFYIGDVDFRKTARCQVNNYILLAFTIILCSTILIKFLAALQLGGKRRPAQQDKFVICQVPAYTEGEDSLRKGLDSLTALAYDNKRKLICVICDGMIVGGGNDRPTPKIVLDILGVDPKVDPPALPFKSVGVGSEQLNYGKVYSGLYEYEGNVVPYLVIVKVGKESEQAKSKPGNRGKRDSQILLMSFLNRVHHRSAMNPLELEMFHQINNIIGVDPELYEYLFMVDADTKVKEDSLNRLVAACSHDAKIAGICGETSLENEERSWWTMIQVYEYYISHHLAKAFESLFGSVTCLPGCFCMYRLRTVDKGRPLIISDKVITEYADNNIDTLHKKNLLSLGEDRYLTTLMTKHFPAMSYKFVPDAYALTEAPAEWSVLLSQRRRWINSTIHNLAELVFLKDLCGFCCFSMRFVVFIDLFGTIILPATCAYLVYLIVRVATHTGQFPLISIIMIACVYGLQAVIFIIKRQWQHIGWMIIYILAYPIYSFVLPVYSFWKQDDFSWGNTRIVIGEKGDRKVVATDDVGFDPRSVPLQRWDDYALQNGLPGRRGLAAQEKEMMYEGGMAGAGYEMDDMHSVYSSVKPASTILTGFPGMGGQQHPQSQSQMGMYRPPPQHRQSTYSHLSRYTDHPQQPQQMMDLQQQQQQHLMSMGGYQSPPPQQYAPSGMRSPYGMGAQSRPVSTANLTTLSGFQTQGPTNEAIIQAIRECLAEVDMDSVTKKQVKVLVEQKLQCQLVGEKRAFLDERIDVELANM
ncbi:glycosyltransferase family 2 protein [Baudoinia panamericana UAMH 10762]|uniref:chitin synthase n=1 Tax=Baudoinia panamericana (strain UAMH 10762) TaxID=717646 RepID=M2LQZ9_BAUPA|nr:glycosyltransferase family 2 protein [Baudoinia panamericana UAMH 10762]EMC96857.1 glycosyltransferase family 2 protein [Baudoinia panamericana UAMH 10762]